MCLYLLLGLPLVVMWGYDFGQVGANDGHAGVIHKVSRFAGAFPPNMWSKGGIPKTPRAPRSRQPQQRARKKKRKYVRARQGLRTPC